MAYIVNVQLLLRVETATEAADGMNELLRPLLKTNNELSCLADYRLLDPIGDESFLDAGPIPEDFSADDAWPTDL